MFIVSPDLSAILLEYDAASVSIALGNRHPSFIASTPLYQLVFFFALLRYLSRRIVLIRMVVICCAHVLIFVLIRLFCVCPFLMFLAEMQIFECIYKDLTVAQFSAHC